MSLLVWRK